MPSISDVAVDAKPKLTCHQQQDAFCETTITVSRLVDFIRVGAHTTRTEVA